MSQQRTTRAALAVEDRMFRALAVLRLVVLTHAVVLNAYRDKFERPALAWTCLVVMIVASLASVAIYAAPERRTPAVLVVDLGLAVAMLLATPVVKGEWFNASLPGYWIAGALLAWAARFGWLGGTAAGLLLGACDLLTRSSLSQQDWGNVFLLLLGGSMVGYLCESLKAMASERDLAQREAAAAAERARLARVVHDGVLQVLAMVQRRGAEIGGEAAELGRLAGEQEESLRRLIRSQAAVTPASADSLPGEGPRDLAAALGALAGRGVEVALPAGAVELSGTAVSELVAAVGACVENVRRHVGEGATAWVLLEDLGDRVEVSVRDDGPGIPDGRLERAAAEGRMGVSESIRGRIADLGGSTVLDTGSFGTEWTFVVPR